jgi:hypothetical protein
MKKAITPLYSLLAIICLYHPVAAQFNQSPLNQKPAQYDFFRRDPSLGETQTPQPYQFTPININTSPSLRRPIFPNVNPIPASNAIEEKKRHVLQQNEAVQQQAQHADIENELMEIERKRKYKEWLAQTIHYRGAYNQLMQMNVDSFSLTDATFLVENAYLDGQLSYEKYLDAINFKVKQVKQILRRQQMDSTSDLALNYGIQKLFSQPNNYYNAKAKQVITVPPFKYDFDDYLGEKDYTKTFVSKLLVTGKGQCQNMPKAYKIIAEQLHAKAWLSLAPQHSFIRFKDGHGNLINFECTNGNPVSMNWMLQSGFINANALKSKIYLDTLSQKQLFAQCLAELLLGYLSKFPYDGFADHIGRKILEINPENITALMVDANIKTEIAMRQIIAAGKPPVNELPKHPDAYKAYLQMHAAYEKIDDLGYQDMPKEAYQKWLQSLDHEKKNQENRELKERMQKEIESLKKVKHTFINKPLN